jgi:hypothetical protein
LIAKQAGKKKSQAVMDMMARAMNGRLQGESRGAMAVMAVGVGAPPVVMQL